MKTMNIAIPDGLKQYVKDRVANGGYSSASEYIRELIRADQQTHTNGAEALPPVAVTAARQPDATGFRSVEIEWRRRNAPMLAQTYRGQWLAIEGEEVIAAGTDLAEVVAAARRRQIQSPYVVHIDPRPADVVRMGL